MLKKEADDINKKTIKAHERAKMHEQQIKIRQGRFSNSYAPENLRMATYGG